MPKDTVRLQTPANRKKTAALNAQWKKWNDVKDAGKNQRKYLAKSLATTKKK
jgi:hypothetical protein